MMTAVQKAATNFLEFVNKTGSPYHSVVAAKEILDNSGFTRLDEREGWPSLQKGGKYYVTRNHSTIMAFVVGKKFNTDQKEKGGFVIGAAHTDSPCLRVRPSHDITCEGYKLTGVETYGGGLWHTWFDRGLGFAGKAVLKSPNGSLEEKLVRVPKPVMLIPNLAIHLLTAEERKAFTVNPENHLRPITCSAAKYDPIINKSGSNEKDVTPQKHSPILQMIANELKCKATDIVDIDVCLMDATPSRLSGFHEEFVESPRIDNLSSTWAVIDAIVEASKDQDNISSSKDVWVAISFDHEEIGSESWVGANSSMLERWLHQIVPDANPEDYSCLISRSFFISSDAAHGVHPNYGDKHQAQNKPMLQGGIVIKENTNQRYASIASTMALTREVALQSDPVVLIQNFVVKNDSPCGSTVGPMSTARLGMRGVDIGLPQWAMHSIRETCGVEDLFHLRNLIQTFYLKFRETDDATTFL